MKEAQLPTEQAPVAPTKSAKRSAPKGASALRKLAKQAANGPQWGPHHDAARPPDKRLSQTRLYAAGTAGPWLRLVAFSLRRNGRRTVDRHQAGSAHRRAGRAPRCLVGLAAGRGF